MRKSVLVVVPQVALRAAVARVLMQTGNIVEFASNTKRARELLAQRKFDAAIMASLSGAEGLRLTREVQAAVQKLVILADDPRETKRYSAAFTNALVCQSRPLNHTLLLAFLADAPISNEAQAALRETPPERVSFENCTLDLSQFRHGLRMVRSAGGQEQRVQRSLVSYRRKKFLYRRKKFTHTRLGALRSEEWDRSNQKHGDRPDHQNAKAS
jgi:DNA-binding response OmpR family regulator